MEETFWIKIGCALVAAIALGAVLKNSRHSKLEEEINKVEAVKEERLK